MLLLLRATPRCQLWRELACRPETSDCQLCGGEIGRAGVAEGSRAPVRDRRKRPLAQPHRGGTRPTPARPPVNGRFGWFGGAADFQSVRRRSTGLGSSGHSVVKNEGSSQSSAGIRLPPTKVSLWPRVSVPTLLDERQQQAYSKLRKLNSVRTHGELHPLEPGQVMLGDFGRLAFEACRGRASQSVRGTPACFSRQRAIGGET